MVKKAKIRNRYNQVPHLTRDTIWESEKNKETTHKRSALSQEVITRLQGTDKTAEQIQTYHKLKKGSTKEALYGNGQ